MNSTETLLCAICAVSFGATLILLLLSVVDRLASPIKRRVWQMFFSLGLTAVVVVTLARV